MTIQEVIDIVRAKLSDENNTTIWDDNQYLLLASECLRYIHTKHYVFNRDLIDLQPYLQVGETKKYDLPADFQKKEHNLFLDGVEMECVDDNDVRKISNVGYAGNYWVSIS